MIDLDNLITKEGISSFTSVLSYITKLNDLKIHGNKIADNGLTELSKYLSNITSLKLLWLHSIYLIISFNY